MKKYLLLLLLAIAFLGYSHAATIIWTGASGGSWAVGTNWSSGFVPISTDDVVFNTSVTVVVNGTLTVNSIKITNNSSVLFTGTSSTTNITISGPVTSQIDVGSTMTCTGTTNTNRCEINMGFLSSSILNVNGTLNLGDFTTYTGTCRLSCATGSIVNINGALNYVGSGASVAGSAAATFFVNAGGIQEMKRINAGTFPVGTYATTARNIISGLTGATYPAFSSSQLTTWGDIEFSAPGNVCVGAGGTSLFSSSATCENFKVINSGTGNCTIQANGGTTRTITVNKNLTVSASMVVNLNSTSAVSPTATSGFDVKGDVTIDGTITATGTATGSKVVFLGTSIQNISIATITSNVTVTFNNTPGFNLLSNLTMPNNANAILNFTSGVIKNIGGYTVNVQYTNTTSLVGGSSTAFLNGGILQRGIAASTNSYDFPIGASNYYRPVNINFTSAPTIAGTLAANYSTVYPGWPNAVPLVEGAITNINMVSLVGSWFVNAAGGLTGGLYTGTFTQNGSTNIRDYTKTILVKRPTSPAGQDWTRDGTHVTTTGSNTSPTVSRTGMSGFSEFAIAGELNVVLPISLNYINGIKQSGKHLITWKVTCNTTPSATLTLERSADARNFTGVYTISATALRCAQPFDYADAQPLAGMNYYRLKIADANGKITYSNIIALLNATKGFELLNIAPNPVTSGSFKLNATAAAPTKVETVISDVQGRVVSRQTITLIAGYNSIDMNVSNLTKGTYNISGISADDKTSVIRFVKQ